MERAQGGRRWLERPSPQDIAAAESWPEDGLPAGAIPSGKETAVLLRHGFHRWADLYPARQRAVLAAILRAIRTIDLGDDLKDILTVAAAGAGEMAGLAGRWDRYFLKAYEANANHRFAYVPVTAEVNVWGDQTSGRGTFVRRVRQLRKAATWFSHENVAQPPPAARGRPGLHPWSIGRHPEDASQQTPPMGQALVVTGSSQTVALQSGSADLILTDPPYFGDVQYGELSGLFLAWLGVETSLHRDEVVVDGRGKGAGAYEALLILTYHNRTPRAFAALASAFRDAGWHVLSWAWVPSENDRDFAKRDKHACTMDLLVECVPHWGRGFSPPPRPPGDEVEADFLYTAGQGIAQVVENQVAVAELEARLSSQPFLSGPRA